MGNDTPQVNSLTKDMGKLKALLAKAPTRPLTRRMGPREEAADETPEPPSVPLAASFVAFYDVSSNHKRRSVFRKRRENPASAGT